MIFIFFALNFKYLLREFFKMYYIMRLYNMMIILRLDIYIYVCVFIYIYICLGECDRIEIRTIWQRPFRLQFLERLR